MVQVMPRILARKSGAKAAELFIYDDIGPGFFTEGLTAKHVQEQLKEIGAVDELNVHINSPGGDVWDGTAIYNLLRSNGARITVDIDGMAASIASIIAMAGDEIRIAGNAMMMIHDPMTGLFGNAEQLRAAIARLEQAKENLVNTYSSRRSLDRAEVSQLMRAETWMNAKDAVELGFADKITGDVDVMVNLDPTRFTNAPVWAVNRSGQPGSRAITRVKALGL